MDRVIVRPFDSHFSHPDDSSRDYVNEVCQAVRVADHIYLRGQVGQTLDGEMVGIGDPGTQTHQAMDNIRTLLEEAGGGLGDIVKLTVYVTDRDCREPVYRVIAEEMRGVRYCSTGVVVAGLARPEWVVEIEAYAVLAGGTGASA